MSLFWQISVFDEDTESADIAKNKIIIIGRIFESEIILIPPSLKISESSSNGSYRNTDEVWWRYGISRSCDEWVLVILTTNVNPQQTGTGKLSGSLLKY